MTHPLLFLPIALVACIVCVAVKRDSIRDILLDGLRFFLLFTVGCASLGTLLFFLANYLVRIPPASP
ncbi:MAG: hypothetical protein V2A58_14150 [Planctomycetota bacterium]